MTQTDQAYTDSESALLAATLFKCHQERQLIDELSKLRGVNNAANWIPLGGSVDLAPVTRAQQSSGSAALKELVTNARDAMLEHGMGLMSEESRKRVEAMNPDQAWQAVSAEVISFPGQFGAINVALGGDVRLGSEKTPSITVVDTGVGRSVDEFQSTLLSVSKGSENKRGKSYTCGQFGMGSTGGHSFSGLKGYKAYLSRRDGDQAWGVTVARKSADNTHLEYFCPGGAIPSFQAHEFHPYHKPDGETWKGSDGAISHGTAIKLYDYRISSAGEARGAGANKWRINANFVNFRMARMPLPVSCKDFRYPEQTVKKAFVDRRLARGLFSQIDHDIQEQKKARLNPDAEKRSDEDAEADDFYDPQDKPGLGDFDCHTMVWDDPEIGRIVMRVYKVDAAFMDNHAMGNHRIFHHIFGQTHWIQQRKPLLDAKLDALANVAIVEVDASGLSKAANEGVWKADRESLMNNAWGDRYMEGVMALLREDPKLKQWNSECLKQAAAEFAARRGGAQEAENAFKQAVSAMRTQKARGNRQAKSLVNELALSADLAAVDEGSLEEISTDGSGDAESLMSVPAIAAPGSAKTPRPAKTQKNAKNAKLPAARSPCKAPSVRQTAESSAAVTDAFANGKGGGVSPRLEAVEANGEMIDSTLFRISSYSASHIILAFDPVRKEQAMASIAGKTVIYHLAIHINGEMIRLSSEAVYRTLEQQALRDSVAHDQAAQARARGKNAVAEAIKFLSSDAKTLKKFADFDPSMACYAECQAASLVVIHSNKSHLSLRQMEAGSAVDEIETQALIQSWEDAVWHTAGFIALGQLSKENNPEQDQDNNSLCHMTPAERACQHINGSASGIGQGFVCASRQVLSAIGKLKSDRRKGKKVIEVDA